MSDNLSKEFGLSDAAAHIEDVSAVRRSKFDALTSLGWAIIGESRCRFRETLTVLRNADATLATSGQFAVSGESCLSRA